MSELHTASELDELERVALGMPYKRNRDDVLKLIAAARRLLELDARRFPMLGHGYSIPWAAIAPFEQQALANHGQSLETLARRGGLGECEALAVLEGRRWHSMDPKLAHERLLELIAQRSEAWATELGWQPGKESK